MATLSGFKRYIGFDPRIHEMTIINGSRDVNATEVTVWRGPDDDYPWDVWPDGLDGVGVAVTVESTDPADVGLVVRYFGLDPVEGKNEQDNVVIGASPVSLTTNLNRLFYALCVQQAGATSRAGVRETPVGDILFKVAGTTVLVIPAGEAQSRDFIRTIPYDTEAFVIILKTNESRASINVIPFISPTRDPAIERVWLSTTEALAASGEFDFQVNANLGIEGGFRLGPGWDLEVRAQRVEGIGSPSVNAILYIVEKKLP